MLLIVVTLLVFEQVRNHEFVNLDDPLYVTENHHVKAGLSPKSFIHAFTDTQAGYWIPLTWLSLMLDFEFYGLEAGGYHLTNLLFHIANALLLFLLLKRMTGQLWQSAFVAALFAIHPLRVESVAWVTERKDVLSTLFWLLTMWTYCHYIERPAIHRYLLVILTFALGLMAKPMVVTLPFALLLLDFWPLQRLHITNSDSTAGLQTSLSSLPAGQSHQIQSLILEKIPLFALAAISSIITFLTQRSLEAVKSIEEFPLSVRFANAVVSYVKYIGKMIWPKNLAVFYPHAGSSLPLWQTAGAALILVFISFVVVRAARNHPYLVMGWLWYLGTLVPVIGLAQAGEQAMADRFTYIPLIGLFIMFAWGVPEWLAPYRHKRFLLSVSSLVVLSALMILSRSQVQHWRSSVTIYEQALAVTDNNYLAYNNLGVTLQMQGHLEEAIGHYTKALTIKPDYPAALANLGDSYLAQGKVEKAITHLSKALRLDPDYVVAHNTLGLALREQGEYAEAMVSFSRALAIAPEYVPAHNNMGVVLVKQGKLDEAVSHYSKALEINPDYARAHNNMGDALARMGKLDEAVGHLYQALQLEPDLVDAHVNLGTVFFRQARFQEAISHYRRVLQLKPNSPEVHNNLGVALAHQGKFEEAISHFTRALQLKPDYVEAQRNLIGVSQQIGSL
jgi:tetratricopeptide (TPR) repeat protein